MGFLTGQAQPLADKIVSPANALPKTIDQVTALRDIELTNVVVLGKVQSLWGTAVVENSDLREITASGDVNLINTKAHQVISTSGMVRISQPGIRQTVNHVVAYQTVNLQNCALKTVQATQSAFIRDCIVDEVNLSLNPAEEGVLDISDTQVNGRVIVKMDAPAFQMIRNVFSRLKRERVQDREKFKLKVEGNLDKKVSICFEGIEPGTALEYQSTETGYIVSGYVKKARGFF